MSTRSKTILVSIVGVIMIVISTYLYSGIMGALLVGGVFCLIGAGIDALART